MYPVGARVLLTTVISGSDFMKLYHLDPWCFIAIYNYEYIFWMEQLILMLVLVQTRSQKHVDIWKGIIVVTYCVLYSTHMQSCANVHNQQQLVNYNYTHIPGAIFRSMWFESNICEKLYENPDQQTNNKVVNRINIWISEPSQAQLLLHS